MSASQRQSFFTQEMLVVKPKMNSGRFWVASLKRLLLDTPMRVPKPVKMSAQDTRFSTFLMLVDRSSSLK